MAAVLIAGSDLNLHLGQSPTFLDPNLTPELQQVYNAIHILGEYLGALKTNIISDPNQPPDISVRFRRTFWATAAQAISVGAIVCNGPTGTIVNGVQDSEPFPAFEDSSVSVGSTGSRTLLGVFQKEFYVALTAASPSELVQLGVGPGISNVIGAVCGQLIWAASSRSIESNRAANTSTQFVSGRTLVGNGGIYLANQTGSFAFVGATAHWEGYWMPGYPNNSGGTFLYSRTFLYPVGVCVADGYVLFSGFKRSDSIPVVTFP